MCVNFFCQAVPATTHKHVHVEILLAGGTEIIFYSSHTSENIMFLFYFCVPPSDYCWLFLASRHTSV